MWVPSLICSARSRGLWDGVVVTMRLQLAAISSPVRVVWISNPSLHPGAEDSDAFYSLWSQILGDHRPGRPSLQLHF
jgi:hypothetical protein